MNANCLKNIRVLIASVFLISCSNEMSRSKAENILIDHYNYPQVITARLGLGFDIRLVNWVNAKTLVALAEEKLIDFSLASNKHSVYSPNAPGNVMLTESGKRLVQGEPIPLLWTPGKIYYADIAIAKAELVEVTGVINNKRDENTFIVEYTWKYTPYDPNWKQPIADLAGKSTSKVQEAKAMLVLYDDGWRVKEIPNLW